MVILARTLVDSTCFDQYIPRHKKKPIGPVPRTNFLSTLICANASDAPTIFIEKV